MSSSVSYCANGSQNALARDWLPDYCTAGNFQWTKFNDFSVEKNDIPIKQDKGYLHIEDKSVVSLVSHSDISQILWWHNVFYNRVLYRLDNHDQLL